MVRSIRIVSDGTPQGTDVFLDTGERVTGILKIEFGPLHQGKPFTAVLTFVGVDIDMIAETDSIPDILI